LFDLSVFRRKHCVAVLSLQNAERTKSDAFIDTNAKGYRSIQIDSSISSTIFEKTAAISHLSKASISQSHLSSTLQKPLLSA